MDIGYSALQARRSLAVHPDLHDTKFQAYRLCRDGHNGLLRPDFHSDFLHSLRALVCLLGSRSGRADDEMSTYLKAGIRFRCDQYGTGLNRGRPPYPCCMGSANSDQKENLRELHVQSRFDVCAPPE